MAKESAKLCARRPALCPRRRSWLSFTASARPSRFLNMLLVFQADVADARRVVAWLVVYTADAPPSRRRRVFSPALAPPPGGAPAGDGSGGGGSRAAVAPPYTSALKSPTNLLPCRRRGTRVTASLPFVLVSSGSSAIPARGFALDPPRRAPRAGTGRGRMANLGRRGRASSRACLMRGGFGMVAEAVAWRAGAVRLLMAARR